MKTNRLKHDLIAYGPDTRLAYVRFVPSSSAGTLPDANLVEAHGVSSVRQLGTGFFEVNLENKGQAINPTAQIIHSGVTGGRADVVALSTTGSYQVKTSATGSLSNGFDFVFTQCLIRVGA
jgi:hypothetical protein